MTNINLIKSNYKLASVIKSLITYIYTNELPEQLERLFPVCTNQLIFNYLADSELKATVDNSDLKKTTYHFVLYENLVLSTTVYLKSGQVEFDLKTKRCYLTNMNALLNNLFK